MNTWGEIKFKLEMDVPCTTVHLDYVCLFECQVGLRLQITRDGLKPCWLVVITPGANGMSPVCTEETLWPFSASTPALYTQPDKDPLFKAGTQEHWASIPLKVHTHTCTDTQTHSEQV